MNVLAISPEDPTHLKGGLGMHIRKFFQHWKDDADLTIELLTTENCQWQGAAGASSLFQDNIRRMTLDAATKKFDLIHCHDGCVAQIGLDLRKLTGKPLLQSCHLFQHQILSVERISVDDFTNYCVCQEMQSVHEADKVIMYSRAMVNYAKTNFHMCRTDVSILHNGVDIEDYDVTPYTELKEKWGKPTVCFCGRFNRQKGIEIIFDAIRATDKYHWIICGAVPSPITKEREDNIYTRTIKQLMDVYPDRVTHMGFKDGEEKNQIIKGSDVGIMPSLCEPFGISGLEFMAAGVPFVHTGVGGLAEFATKENSIHTTPTTGSLIEGIDYALRQKEQLSAAGLQTAKTYKWDHCVQDTKEIYREMVELADVKNRDAI